MKLNLMYGLKMRSNLASMHFMRKMGTYDVIISGAGMVGAALAGCFGKDPILQSKKVLLLEQTREKKFEIEENYSNRVTAISPQSKQLFQSIGAWDLMVKHRVQEVKGMQVWDACSESYITFNSSGMSEVISYIVENDVILEALWSCIKSIENVETIHGVKIDKFNIPHETEAGKLVNLVLKDGKEISCKLLIGADGMHSGVRKAMKTHYFKWNYDQRAIVATLSLSEPIVNNVAWQRFLPTGPIALLPLSDHKVSLVWSTTKDNAKYLLGLPEDEFVNSVNHAFCSNDDNVSLVNDLLSKSSKLLNSFSLSEPPRQMPPSILDMDSGTRGSYPLGLGHSSDYVKYRVALVGDAAHRIHPLAGLGANLGFGDVITLTDVLRESLYGGAELGSLQALYRYQSRRQRHNIPVMATVDGLYKLYSSNFLPLALVRGLGLQLVNSLPPVKNQLVHMATN